MKRIRILDLIRGLAVVMMVTYHLFYTFGAVLGFPFFKRGYLATMDIAPPIIATLFILTCAYSCQLAKSNVKRGAVIFAVAMGLTAATCYILPLMGMDGEGIRFGILHFLGVAVMLSPLLFKIIRTIPAWLGIPLNIVLAIGTRNLMVRGFFGIPVKDPIQSVNVLFPFGIYHGSFYSADYYPLLPWIFVFAIGCFIALKIPRKSLPKFAYKAICPPVEFLGRHALIIYVIHQPIIFAVGELVVFILKLRN